MSLSVKPLQNLVAGFCCSVLSTQRNPYRILLQCVVKSEKPVQDSAAVRGQLSETLTRSGSRILLQCVVTSLFVM